MINYDITKPDNISISEYNQLIKDNKTNLDGNSGMQEIKSEEPKLVINDYYLKLDENNPISPSEATKYICTEYAHEHNHPEYVAKGNTSLSSNFEYHFVGDEEPYIKLKNSKNYTCIYEKPTDTNIISFHSSGDYLGLNIGIQGGLSYQISNNIWGFSKFSMEYIPFLKFTHSKKSQSLIINNVSLGLRYIF